MTSHDKSTNSSTTTTDHHDYDERYDTNCRQQQQRHSLGQDNKSSHLLCHFQSIDRPKLPVSPRLLIKILPEPEPEPKLKQQQQQRQMDQMLPLLLQPLRPLILSMLSLHLPGQSQQQQHQSRPKSWPHYNKAITSSKLLLSSAIIVTLAVHLASIGQQVQAYSLSLTFDDGNLEPSIGSNLQLQQQHDFVPSDCKLQGPYNDDRITCQVINMLSIFKSELKPLLEIMRKMLPYQLGKQQQQQGKSGEISLNSLDEIENDGGKRQKQQQQQQQLSIWNDYQNMDNLVESFRNEVISALTRKNSCTYQMVERFFRLKDYLTGSRLLTHIYDIITIEYHKSCLAEAISKLPQVPYLIHEVVDIYITGADQGPVLDLNGKPSQLFDEQSSDYMDVDSQFNLLEAIAKNGKLSDVVELSISMPSNVIDKVKTFKDKCREFLLQIEKGWQLMEMMSKMLSTDGNGIQSFNNYVMRRLSPTKFADVCSQLSSASD